MKVSEGVQMQPRQSEPNLTFTTTVTALIAAVVAICAIALFGWASNNTLLASLLPGQTAMNPLTAIGMIALAVTLAILRNQSPSAGKRRLAKVLAAATLAVGVGCIAAYLAGEQFPVDQIVFSDTLAGNRVAPNTALCLILLSSALLLVDRRLKTDFRPFQVLALLAAVLSFLSIVGYGYGTRWLYGVPSFIPMALPTAIVVHALAWGILLSRPHEGLIRALTSRSLGGVMARRIIPAAFLFPVGLGWLRLLGEQAGFYDTSLGVALNSVLTSFGLLAVIWWSARMLNEVDDDRTAAARELQRFNDELEVRVQERTAELSAANRELLQKNEENETFVYSVSHDLRAPLVNLQGFSQEVNASCHELRNLWQDASAKPDDAAKRTLTILDDDVEPSLRFIQSGVLRLSSIIDALLRLSRAGRVEYQWQAVDVAKVSRRIVDSLQDTIHKRNATVTIGELPPAWGDENAIEQIFGNLVANALNYAAPDRDAKIEILSVPSAEEDQGKHTYCVKDNGVGIPALHQCKVFQAFQRLQPKLAQGEGIGLTMTRRIVERHSGRIWFESVEGQGATFFVALPITTVEPTPKSIKKPKKEAAYAH
jgi:signal transduction histidine kinase